MLLQIIHDFALKQGYSQTALDAAHEVHRRKWRISHPAGTFDKAGRFTLEERCACCEGIRAASRAYPYSEMSHGRSLAHVAHLHGVPKLHVQRLTKALDAARSSLEEANSNHAKAQFLIKLRQILKPVRPTQLTRGSDGGPLRNSRRDLPG